jgi:hypothetical protein
MRKNLFLSSIFLFIVLFVNAGIIEKTYYFNDYKISQKGEYQTIQFENTLLTGLHGEPTLPYQAISLLLTPGEKALSIEYILDGEVQIPGTFLLFPHQESRPLSESEPAEFKFNEIIYQSSAYPQKISGEVITQYLNGYAFVLSSFTPVKYNPSTGDLSYYTQVKVVVKTTSDNNAALALNNLSASNMILRKVQHLAQNPGVIKQYPSATKNADDYQLMIITPSQFENNFQDLIDLYLERGIKTEIVTKEYINSNGTGQDLQEKMRNYIIQEYQDHNVEYILLGGDVEHIPYRGFYCYVQSGGGYEDSGIPSDLYYSALDGTWNDDNDNKWGEIGEDDLLPDIAVGRFSFSDASELAIMINKSVMYQNNPVPGELTSPLLAGENMYSGPDTWGADYIELLVGEHDDNGYTTIGIPETQNIETLYERDAPWGGSDLIAKINQGKQFVHHAGHANETYVAHLSSSDITSSNFSGANGTDHNFTLLQTHGCNCGDFTYNDCILEKMVKIENFAVAVMGNSRYGWFNEGQTEGPAAHLHREMIDALYHEKMQHLGAAFAESKIQTSPWVTAPGQWEEGALRWNFYDINILGDPALSVWTEEPINIQTTYQDAIPIGVTSTSVSVTSGGQPMENFKCAIIKDDIIFGVGYTDASGSAIIEFDPVFADVGDATLYVSGYNCKPHSYDVSIIPNDGAYVIYTSHEIDDSQGNGNGEVDFGESIYVDLEIENVGSEDSENVMVTLTTDDDYIIITDGSENFGNLAGGTSNNIAEAFAFDVSEAVPDQHNVTFDLEMVGNDTWYSQFGIIINAPDLAIGSISIDDIVGGNGNGILDPGETADVVIESMNMGHCACASAEGMISTGSTYINLITSEVALGVIEAGETTSASFTIEVTEDAPLGGGFDLIYQLTSGSYTAQESFYLAVGLVYEDFETGDFSAFEWQDGGNSSWTITNVGPYEGVYSAKSGNISDDQTSELYINMDVISDDEISFFRKVSSEANYDYLRFYIDDNMMDEWAGEENWAEISYPVSAGVHVFKWIYYKDQSVSNGDDCAWIDYIIFPAASGSANPLSVTITAIPNEICSGEESQLTAFAGGGTGTYSYEWSPETGLNNPDIYNPIATPTETTTYMVTVSDGNSSISASKTITVYPTPETPIINQVDNSLVSTSVEGNQWYNSNGMINGATAQTYYPTATDQYYVIVTNSNGCVSNSSNVINFIYTSVNENRVNDISIYPNPFTNHFTVEYRNNIDANVSIVLYDHLGKEVQEMLNEKQSPGFYQLEMTKTGLITGVYFIRIQSEEFIYMQKLVLTK